jgi:DNA polymerase-3 subunit beta
MATAARKKAEAKMTSPDVLPNMPDFSIGKETLFGLLEHLHGIVEKRNTIPILGHVLIAAVDGKIVIKASDLDREAEEFVDAAISKPGAVTVNAQALYDSVKRVKAGADLRFEAIKDGSILKMTSGRMSAELFCLPATDFPSMAGAEFAHTFSIEDKALVRLLGKSKHAMSTEETRHYLNGVYLHEAKGGDGEPKLRACATDGHQLARIDAEIPSGAEGIPGVILPTKLVNELIRIIGNGSGEAIKVEISSAKARFTVGAFSITSKLIDGSFPDYARVIPDNKKCKAVISAADLKTSIEFVSSGKTTRATGLAFSEEEIRVYRNQSEDAGSAQDFVEADYSGSPFEAGFNPRYLLNVIDIIEGEKIVAKLNDGSSPAVFLDEGDDGVLFVVMPMRL